MSEIKRNVLPLRIGVGIIVLNHNNQVFVGKRKDNPIDRWQMPQGGVDKNEPLLTAMKRELFEETSITNIQIIKELNDWFEYYLPKNLVGKIWRGRFRGQKQKWFIVKFIGDEKEININTKHPEFIEWKWLEIDELPNVIVDFKKRVYDKLVLQIKGIIN
ncbi:MAG: RNA pyrophosphohydrolase [Candidatus Pelagibacter sp. TMED165]|nr:MAG: RNA pyrophosphohydrolase [Candidatus Pelagibacter sp. TMED165]|tara:strand:- start:513 stop:992 length:480 start_codon:yes stop_codon:yes gene_type:complete